MSNVHLTQRNSRASDFVLEKGIFNNIFEKDIRRVFIYKKAEHLAKALYLILPAFAHDMSLTRRLTEVAVKLIDSAVLPPGAARAEFSRELLALSSILSLARTGNLLSAMNADIIMREAHGLLEEVAWYEEPRISLDELPTLSALVRKRSGQEPEQRDTPVAAAPARRHLKDIPHKKDTSGRKEAIMSVIRTKHKVGIKDISMLVRGVSEKTIQRELSTLIEDGAVLKQGERRWSTYTLSGPGA